MRIFLNLVLILVCFFACTVEDIYFYLRPPQTGAAIPFTIRLRHSFNFDQEKALGIQRTTALSNYVPLCTFIPQRAADAEEELQGLFARIAALRLQKPTAAARDLEGYVRTVYGVHLKDEVVKKIFRYPDLKNFIDGLLLLQQSTLQAKIIEDVRSFAGKKAVEILYPRPSGIVVSPIADLITLEAAKVTFREKAHQLFWTVDKDVLEAMVSIAAAALRPNLLYDAEENKKRLEDIIGRYPSKVISFEEGRILVPFRHALSENDLLLVQAYRDEVEKDLPGRAPWVFIAVLLTAVLYSLIFERVIEDEWRKDPPYPLFLSLLSITILVLKSFLLWTPLPVAALPFGTLPLMLVLLQSDKISAACTTLAAAALVSLFSGGTLNILLFFAFTGLATMMIALKIRKRIHLIAASLTAGGVNAVLAFLFWLDWTRLFSTAPGTWLETFQQVISPAFLQTLGWAFIGGAAACPLALILLPLLEMTWHTASSFRLNRYADLQHPLLKELLTKTPATYQHTMTVAYLAQSVGEAVGANTLLLRIGAYYHDIGKVTDPRYFGENQTGKNPHDDLDPQESARIIIDHVINGEKIGRGMKLPQAVLDFITQHHGTLAVEYFYNKAVKSSRGGKVRKTDFQYPGPKPQSAEAAIVMLCDAVEAASRSLQSPTRETIDNMVRLLLVKRIADGQFDECHLSTGCLAQVVRTLVDSIEASFHTRVVYPWQEKQKEVVLERTKKAASA